MKERAVIDCYREEKGAFLVVPLAVDENWIARAVDHIQVLPSACTDEELGRAIRVAEGWAEVGQPDPSNPLPHIRVSKSKSWRQFVRSHHLVEISITLEVMKVLPTGRDLRGGYAWREQLGVVVPLSTTDTELGASVKAAFDHCSNEITS